MHWAVATSAGTWLTDRFYVKPSCRSFRHSLQHPHRAQEQIFDVLLARGRRTRFGCDHDFAHIRTLNDYQRAVPVRRYEDMKPYVDSAVDGEVDVLWPGRVDWVLESSGTSGKKKQIPLPREAWRRLYLPTGAIYMAQLLARVADRHRFLRGKTLFFGGGLHLDPAQPRRIFGDVTAFGIHLLPWYLGFSRAPRKEIALIPNWEERLHRMAEATLRDIVTWPGLPTWLRNFGSIVLAMTGKRTLREVWPN
ncbi:MAG: GH3 auxin-responsive promoter family protein [Caldilineaceae bacterium]